MPQSSRRDFLKQGTTGLATAAGIGTTLSAGVHVGARDTIKVGLIGCGGRGTGAATQALRADSNVQLVAMGDVFADRLKRSLATLRREEDVAAKVQVKEDCCFSGFDAYKQVIASGVDLVLLTTPPHFRPIHLQAAVEAGKHCFVEKPVAVDGPGVRAVLASCEAAKKKSLAVVSGLCYRYENSKREVMQRVHDGAIGDIITLHTSYNTGFLWSYPRQDNWSDMEWQLRNWLYFNWLSGDHIVEQHVHSLDKMAWAMKDQYPVKASGLGGRQVRTDPAFGNIFDHHSVVFEYANGVKCFSNCRQIEKCHNDVSDYVMGTKGTADVMRHQITGQNPWRLKRTKNVPDDMYQNEHNELFASIRKGEPINNGEFMCKSTLMGIMGRTATYTGQLITWDQVMNSQEKLGPEQYAFGSLPVDPIPMPGKTRFS